jgi:hypothetical protein
MAVIGRLRNNNAAAAIQSHITYSGSAGTHRDLKNREGKVFLPTFTVFLDFPDFFPFSTKPKTPHKPPQTRQSSTVTFPRQK